MNVNGITSKIDSYPSYSKVEVAKKEVTEAADKAVETVTNDSGVVYEPSLETPTQIFKSNEEVLARLKADAQARTKQLHDLVMQLITKQAGTYSDAFDMWNFLREGNFEVDAETKAQAQADIAEDGYWGVKQTSDRIIDFAQALTGGDPAKLQSMMDAFKKGYAQAEKTWGGELPEISKKTYDAVIEKFNNLMNPTDSVA